MNWQELNKIRAEHEAVLVANLRASKPSLDKLLTRANSEWSYEDSVYRFYHQSFKVYRLQDDTKEIVGALAALNPKGSDVALLNTRFVLLYQEGTTQTFSTGRSNANWSGETRPIVEAFFHAKFFLEMAVKYADDSIDGLLPSGWAALLCLYNLR